MVEQEIQTKIYELAYHLSADLEEAEMKKEVEGLEKVITQNGGSVLSSNEPAKKHLSYPLRHKSQSYFGVLDFNVTPEKIEKINSQMKLIGNVMRYLLIQKPKEGKTLTLTTERSPRTKTREGVVTKKEPAAPKVSEEKITEELEGVLEKI